MLDLVQQTEIMTRGLMGYRPDGHAWDDQEVMSARSCPACGEWDEVSSHVTYCREELGGYGRMFRVTRLVCGACGERWEV